MPVTFLEGEDKGEEQQVEDGESSLRRWKKRKQRGGKEGEQLYSSAAANVDVLTSSHCWRETVSADDDDNQ